MHTWVVDGDVKTATSRTQLVVRTWDAPCTQGLEAYSSGHTPAGGKGIPRTNGEWDQEKQQHMMGAYEW